MIEIQRQYFSYEALETVKGLLVKRLAVSRGTKKQQYTLRSR